MNELKIFEYEKLNRDIKLNIKSKIDKSDFFAYCENILENSTTKDLTKLIESDYYYINNYNIKIEYNNSKIDYFDINKNLALYNLFSKLENKIDKKTFIFMESQGILKAIFFYLDENYLDKIHLILIDENNDEYKISDLKQCKVSKVLELFEKEINKSLKLLNLEINEIIESHFKDCFNSDYIINGYFLSKKIYFLNNGDKIMVDNSQLI